MPAAPETKNTPLKNTNARKSAVFRMSLLSGMTLMLVTAATLQYKWAPTWR